MKYIANLLPHFCIVISGMMMVLLIIDIFNTNMNFIDNSITKRLLMILMVAVVSCSIMLIKRQRQD